MKYAFVRDHEVEFGVARMCWVLGVSRSGYYHWRDRPESARVREDRELLRHIRRVHRENRCAYGAIKTWQEVCGQGIGCGKHRVAHLRRQAGIQAQRRRRFRITVENHHSLPPALKSFFSNLKNELVHHCDFASREQARAAIFDYIELFYNRQRRHQALGYVSPAQFEQQGGVA